MVVRIGPLDLGGDRDSAILLNKVHWRSRGFVLDHESYYGRGHEYC